MTHTRTQAACAALILALAAGAAQAQMTQAQMTQAQTTQAQPADRADQLLGQAAPAALPSVNDGEAYHRADDAQQDPAELRTTQALNDEITSRNQLAENQERADQTAFQAAQAAYEQAATAATQARLAYEDDLRRSEAAQRQWEADRARWAADVRACEAGDRSRCGRPAD